MRKVHHKVTLDVLTYENEDIDGNETLMRADFWPSFEGVSEIDVIDVNVENIWVTDSR